VTSSLVCGTASAGHEVEVICFDIGRKQRVVREKGVDVRRFHPLFTVSSQPLSARYFFACIRAGRRSNLIHVHAPNLLAMAACLLLTKKTKVVIHWHSDILDKGLFGRLIRPIERLALRRASQVIATSEPYSKGSTALARFKEKVTVVPLGIPSAGLDEPTASPVLPAEVGDFARGRQIILAVGRLVSYKGFDVLISAVKNIHADAAAVIVGEGPEYSRLSALIAESALQERVLLLGSADEQTLLELQQAASVFCLPSTTRQEAFGVAIIEAMRAGLPVVASDIKGSGVPWVNDHGKTGFNAPPNDTEALAKAIDDVLSDASFREQLAEGARRRFREHFTEERMIRQTLALYSEILARGKA